MKLQFWVKNQSKTTNKILIDSMQLTFFPINMIGMIHDPIIVQCGLCPMLSVMVEGSLSVLSNTVITTWTTEHLKCGQCGKKK